MAPRRYVVVVATLVTTVLVVAGVVREPTVVDDDPVAQVPEVPLAEIPLAEVNASRMAFCDQIPAEAVADAVGAVVPVEEHRSGEATRLEPGLKDVAHEFGCTYDSAGTTARVWVFAAPVSAFDAQELARDTSTRDDCSPGGVLRFGDPGTTLDCTEGPDRVFRAAGRIGDAWVHCELQTPAGTARTGFLERAQRWCVAAVYAMQS